MGSADRRPRSMARRFCPRDAHHDQQHLCGGLPAAMTTDAWGVDDQYEDALGAVRTTSPETRAAIHRAMGVEPGQESETPAVLVVQPGVPNAFAGRGEIELESGGSLPVDGPLPAGLPLGYHWFFPERGASSAAAERGIRLIVSPGRCYLPPDLKVWGWAVQLYAARRRRAGDWRPGRSGGARPLVAGPGRGHRDYESTGRRGARLAAGSESLLSQQPAVSQSALLADRKRARLRRAGGNARAAGTPGSRAQCRPARRSRSDLPAEDGSPRAALAAVPSATARRRTL